MPEGSAGTPPIQALPALLDQMPSERDWARALALAVTWLDVAHDGDGGDAAARTALRFLPALLGPTARSHASLGLAPALRHALEAQDGTSPSYQPLITALAAVLRAFPQTAEAEGERVHAALSALLARDDRMPAALDGLLTMDWPAKLRSAVLEDLEGCWERLDTEARNRVIKTVATWQPRPSLRFGSWLRHAVGEHLVELLERNRTAEEADLSWLATENLWPLLDKSVSQILVRRALELGRPPRATLQAAGVDTLTEYLRLADDVGEQAFELVVDQLDESETTRQAAANYIDERLDHENVRRPNLRWSESCITLLIRRLIGPSEAAGLYSEALDWLESSPVFQNKEPRVIEGRGIELGVRYNDEDRRVMEHRLHVVRMMRVLNQRFASEAPTAQRVRDATTWAFLARTTTPELSSAIDELVDELTQLERQVDLPPAVSPDSRQDLELSLGYSTADVETSSD